MSSTVRLTCACGCGKRVTFDPSRNRMNRFVHGHHRRTKPFVKKRQKPMTGICACGCGGKIQESPKHKWRPTYFLPGHHVILAAKQGRPHHARYIPPTDQIPSGVCECGCGQRTNISNETVRSKRHFMGYPMPFFPGHSKKTYGPDNPSWRGGFVHADGYVYRRMTDHPRANSSGYVYEHRLVVEQKIGRYLKPTERVHHINGDKADNRPENLELVNGNHGPGVCLQCEDCGSTRLIPGELIPGAPRWIRHRPPLSAVGNGDEPTWATCATPQQVLVLPQSIPISSRSGKRRGRESAR